MKKNIIYVLISTFMFSSMEIVLKTVSDQFSPIQLNLIRFFIGSLILLPIAISHLRSSSHRLKIADFLIFAMTGFFCVIVSMTLYQLAIVYDQPATVAVIFSCNPVFALIFAFLILRERMNRYSIISLVLSIIGLLVIVNPANLTNPLGIALGVSSALTFGLYSIISRWGSMNRGFDGITMTAFTFLMGSIELLAVILITNINSVSLAMQKVAWLKPFASTPILKNVNLEHFWVLFFIGVCVTGGGFAFYFLAMQYGGVSIASLVFFIKPALAPILAMIFIHAQITLNMVIGIVIILISSVITFIGTSVANKRLPRDGVTDK